MSTHAASMPLRCRALNSSWKNSSKVSFFRSRPNHSGSPLSRLLATVRNFCFLPRWISSTPNCRNPGFRRPAAHVPDTAGRSIAPCSPPAPPAWPPACRRALAGFPHRVLEPFAERSLARQLRDLLGLHPAIRTAHPIQLDHDCRPVLKARQIMDLPFANLGDLAHASSTTAANQLPLAGLAAHPQSQRLGFFIDLAPIHPVARPSQNPRPLVVSQTAECSGKTRQSASPSDSCAEPFVDRYCGGKERY